MNKEKMFKFTVAIFSCMQAVVATATTATDHGISTGINAETNTIISAIDDIAIVANAVDVMVHNIDYNHTTSEHQTSADNAAHYANSTRVKAGELHKSVVALATFEFVNVSSTHFDDNHNDSAHAVEHHANVVPFSVSQIKAFISECEGLKDSWEQFVIGNESITNGDDVVSSTIDEVVFILQDLLPVSMSSASNLGGWGTSALAAMPAIIYMGMQ